MGSRVLHISEDDPLRGVRTILQRVQTGAVIVVERDAQPVAVIRGRRLPRLVGVMRHKGR